MVLCTDLKRIVAEKALVSRNSEHQLVLREKNVMEVEITDAPQHVIAINLMRIGSLSGIKEGEWKKTCDYLLICTIDRRDVAIFIELKKVVYEDNVGMEQLRRSTPILEYLRDMCRIQPGARKSRSRLIVRYLLIGMKRRPRFDKQRVRPNLRSEKQIYKDINVHTFLGGKIRFNLLSGLVRL